MVLRSYTFIDYASAKLGAVSHSYYVGDTFADLPTSGMGLGDLAFDKATGILYAATNASTLRQMGGVRVFSKGGAFYDPTVVPVATIVTWTAPFACTVTAIKGYRTGGTGATVNAYRGTSATPLRSTALSLTSAGTWMDGGAVQNTAFAIGDSLLIGIVSVTGSVTQIAVQVNFTQQL